MLRTKVILLLALAVLCSGVSMASCGDRTETDTTISYTLCYEESPWVAANGNLYQSDFDAVSKSALNQFQTEVKTLAGGTSLSLQISLSIPSNANKNYLQITNLRLPSLPENVQKSYPATPPSINPQTLITIQKLFSSELTAEQQALLQQSLNGQKTTERLTGSSLYLSEPAEIYVVGTRTCDVFYMYDRAQQGWLGKHGNANYQLLRSVSSLSMEAFCDLQKQIVNDIKDLTEDAGYAYFRELQHPQLSSITGVPPPPSDFASCGLDLSKVVQGVYIVNICYPSSTSNQATNPEDVTKLVTLLNEREPGKLASSTLLLQHSSVSTEQSIDATKPLSEQRISMDVAPINAYTLFKQTGASVARVTLFRAATSLQANQVRLAIQVPVLEKETEPSNPDPDTGISDNTVTAPDTAGCGNQEQYVKLCYDYARNIPWSPTGYTNVLAQYIRGTRKEIGTGYLTIVETDSSAAASSSETDAGQQRIIDLKRKVQAAVEASELRGSITTTPVVAAIEVEKSSPTEQPKAYVFTEETWKNKIKPSGAFSNRPDFVAAVDAAFVDLDAKSRANWETYLANVQAGIGTDKDNLIRKIWEKTKIPVFYVPSKEHLNLPGNRFTVDNEGQLKEQIYHYLQSKEATQVNLQKEEYNPNTQLPKSVKIDPDKVNIDDSVPFPCGNYVLDDEDGVHLYYSDVCRLKVFSRDMRGADPGEETITLLESAYKNTEEPDPINLLLAAHRMIAKGNVDEGRRLALWVYKTWGEQPGVNGSVAIITAYAQLKQQLSAADAEILPEKTGASTGEPYSDIITLIDANIDIVDSRFKPLAANIAVEAASRLGFDRCSEMDQTIDRYRSYLRRSSSLRTALDALQRCNENQIANTCGTLDESKTAPTRKQIVVVYVDDFHSSSEITSPFAAQSNTLKNGLLEMGALEKHQSKFFFKKVTAPARITTSAQTVTGRPKVDTKLLKEIERSCEGDVYIVLSDKEFYPGPLAGSVFLSSTACSGDSVCMRIYQARGIAFNLFHMQPEPGTITAPLSSNPKTSTLSLLFSANQRNIIDEYMRDKK